MSRRLIVEPGRRCTLSEGLAPLANDAATGASAACGARVFRQRATQGLLISGGYFASASSPFSLLGLRLAKSSYHVLEHLPLGIAG